MALHTTSLMTTSLLMASMFAACGPGEETADSQAGNDQQPTSKTSTDYGSPEEVGEYLKAIEPFIQGIGTIQSSVDKALGSSGKGTGENLAPLATAARDQLNQLLGEFKAVQPPPLLAPFHRDIKKLIALRLEAYAATIEGWELEQGGGDFRGRYDLAQENYTDANEVILQLNEEVAEIHQAVKGAPGS